MDGSIIGVVLCGGDSKRMGADKGLLLWNNKTWAEIAVQKLEHVVHKVHVSVNPNQISNYQKLFPHHNLIIDSVECRGPLAGLLSAHKEKPENDILLLACDMVKLDIQTLKKIHDSYCKDKYYDFYVYSQHGEYEPLPGIYTSKGMRNVFSHYQNGTLRKHSLKYQLENGNTFTLYSESENLTSYNSPSDFDLS